MHSPTMPAGPGHSGLWISRWIFVLAAAGSAIGLGNIWKFPYLAGIHGGGAFVIVYLLCVLVIGMPVLMAEIVVGRRARAAPIDAVAKLARESGARKAWAVMGWIGTIAGILILSFYSMIAGWALHYLLRMARGDFAGADAAQAVACFNSLQASPVTMFGWHTLFMALTVGIVARGVNDGLERSVRWMMPILALLLVALVAYATTSGEFLRSVDFLFAVDFSRITGEAVLAAMGQAFFSLSLGMCAIMAYGAYMPSEQSIGAATLWIAGLDTLFALLAGLAIFPIVFAHGLPADSGPGLMFVSLPLAFGNLPFGEMFGGLFFLLVLVAALTSSISLLEPFVAWISARRMSRSGAALLLGGAAWILGLLSILSFNLIPARSFDIGGLSMFEALDFLTTNIMLPLGGLLLCVFVGWSLKETKVMKELGLRNQAVYIGWRIALRIIAPLSILAVLLNFLGAFS